jgi:CHAD domain-containing protein
MPSVKSRFLGTAEETMATDKTELNKVRADMRRLRDSIEAYLDTLEMDEADEKQELKKADKKAAKKEDKDVLGE